MKQGESAEGGVVVLGTTDGLCRKRRLAGLLISVVCLAGMMVAVIHVKNFLQNLSSSSLKTNVLMSDFGTRYNEVCCVKEGINPFDVWRGAVVDARYEPWSLDKMYAKRTDFSRCIHAYPPWEYTFMLPFARFDRLTADHVFMFLMVGGILFLSCGWFWCGCRQTCRFCWGLLLCALFWIQTIPVEACLFYGNFGIWIAVSVAVALYCHFRKWDGWDGVFWALATVKPQIATIFLVPILLLRKWRTLLVWGAVLSGATLVPAILCRCSPVDMVLCITEYSAGQFNYTGFIGRPIFASFVDDGGISPSLLSGASALAGGLICAVCTLLIVRRREQTDACSDLAAFVPALVLSTIWTTSRIYDFCIHGVTTPLLVFLAIKTGDRLIRYASVLLALVTASMFVDQFQSGRVNVCSLFSVLALVFFSYRMTVGDRSAGNIL